MKVVSLDQVSRVEVDMEGAEKVCKQVPVGQSDGSPTFSVRVFTIRPDGHTPFHSHASEHLNYVIEGRGVLVDEGGEEQEIRKGQFALVLPGEKHQYRNTSQKEDMVMICAVPKEYE